ncbi:hypothetical protein [Paraglaciecola hydrolytica]|uniref:Prephenate dehydrogenase n=1 Tax=Paraglaciecola hydrolytica TaxID=1799789 RepID=A0A136A5P1_9ALTE|nr:hypothetical protein [Paraglaciecola hydrolytica]KXI30568.1 hypothetical protein AX660_09800 [Paraglaciecola hydrolytica]
MNIIIEKLTENMQLIYRKAIDADEAISRLRTDGKGKFTAIFPSDSGFSHQGKFFKAYVEELASDIKQLTELDDETQKTALAPIVKKMELLLSTLGQFQRSVR